MSKLSWDGPGERIFETGLDRGVLYPKTGPGVAWNGLTALNEAPSGGEARPFYLDGQKYMNISAKEEFAATLEAFTYPDEFEISNGVRDFRPGFSATQQKRVSFSFSYRTLVGDDLKSLKYGYKIHIVYNALASPSAVSNTSIADNADLINFSWGLTTTPILVPGMGPLSHVVLDSTKLNPALLQLIESYLYGSELLDPTLLMPADISEIFDNPPLEIVPDPIGGTADLILGNFSDLRQSEDSSDPSIYLATEDTRLKPTSQEGVYTLDSLVRFNIVLDPLTGLGTLTPATVSRTADVEGFIHDGVYSITERTDLVETETPGVYVLQ